MYPTGDNEIGARVCLVAVCALGTAACVDAPTDRGLVMETTTGGQAARNFSVEIGRVVEGGEMSAGFTDDERMPVVASEGGPYEVTVALRMPRDVPDWLVAEANVAFAEPGFDHGFRQPRLSCPPAGDYRICGNFGVLLYHEREFLGEQDWLELSVELWAEGWRGTGNARVPIQLEEASE